MKCSISVGRGEGTWREEGVDDDLRGARGGGDNTSQARSLPPTLAEHSYRKGPDNRRKTSTRPETVRLLLCSGLASIAPTATSKKSGLDLDKSNEPR